MTRIFAALVITCAMVGSAAAQGKEATQKAPVRVKNVAIEADHLTGEIPVALGDVRPGRAPVQHGSLIQPRADFVREIVRSADDL